MSDTTTSTLAAALWDFDGTLADTEPLWLAAEYELIGQLGGTWSDEHAEQLVGNSLLDSGSYILNAIGRVDLSPAWVVEQLLTTVVNHIRRYPIVWRPGAIELLGSFAAAGVPCALVSASYRVLLDVALSQLPEGTFQVSVAGDEVSRGKPHPEPYEKACTALGVCRSALRGHRRLRDGLPRRERCRSVGGRRAQPRRDPAGSAPDPRTLPRWPGCGCCGENAGACQCELIPLQASVGALVSEER